MSPPTSPERPTNVVDRLLRDGSAAIVNVADVSPSQISALRSQLMGFSAADRRRVYAAIDQKLTADVHADVRSGLERLRASVGLGTEIGLTAAEMQREIPRGFQSGATREQQNRALVALAAIGGSVAAGWALFKGKFRQFLGWMLLPGALVAARLTGWDPLSSRASAAVPTTQPVAAPDGTVDFAAVEPTANLLNQMLRYRDGGGTERQVRLQAPASGLRYRHNGREFVILGPASAGGANIAPITGIQSLTRSPTGGLALNIDAGAPVGVVSAEMDSASADRLLEAARAPGDAIRAVRISCVIPSNGPRTFILRTALSAAGVTSTNHARGLSVTTDLYVRPTTAAEQANPATPIAPVARPS